ncbi:MAG: hypothetical protein ACI8XO_004382 [Verrucomicrobiales bacterium]|jgi:hypothetical protein
MGTGRKFNKTHLTRPRKAAGPRRRRRIEQKRRLVSLGMDTAEVDKLTSREVLTLLQRPKKITDALAAKGE